LVRARARVNCEARIQQSAHRPTYTSTERDVMYISWLRVSVSDGGVSDGLSGDGAGLGGGPTSVSYPACTLRTA
jgi:hypothetical protein